MADTETQTIEVDPHVAELLQKAALAAKARGETLGSYLSRALPSDVVDEGPTVAQQREAWEGFVQGMTEWARDHLPPGHFVDDSRDSMYD